MVERRGLHNLGVPGHGSPRRGSVIGETAGRLFCSAAYQGRPGEDPERCLRTPGASSTARYVAWPTEAQADVTALVSENRARLDALAWALLEHETLDASEAYAAAGLPACQSRLPRP